MYFPTTLLDCTDCTNLLVMSDMNQPEYAGQYRRTGQQLNGRPVYKHVTCQLYLYYIEAHTGAWVFSPLPGEFLRTSVICLRNVKYMVIVWAHTSRISLQMKHEGEGI